MRSSAMRLVLIVGLVASTVACDQSTKHLARTVLRVGETRRVVGDFVILTYAENEGAFLSLGARWPHPVRVAVFSVLSLLVVAAAAVYLIGVRQPGIGATVGLSLAVGGGVGNLVDRLARGGYVTDFLNVGVGGLRTGIFNLADVFLMAGMLMLVIAFSRKRPQ